MRTVAINEFGGPEVLEVADLAVPEPGDGDVRIHVAAATVNPTDAGMRSDNRRAALEQFEKPYVPGMELAGVVDKVGSGVTLAVGDRVMAIAVPNRTGRGAQSEYVVLSQAQVAPAPQHATLEEAATIPMNGLTVRRAFDLLGLAPGQWLVVTGAAGAVGGYAVEIGALEGLRVIGVASPDDEALVRGFGAEHFLPRGEDVPAEIRKLVPDGVDAVIDAALIGPPILAAIADKGKLAVVRGWNDDTERDIEVLPVSVGEYAENTEALRELGQLADEGKLTLRVAKTFPPEQAGDAHRTLAAGGVRGRLLIVF